MGLAAKKVAAKKAAEDKKLAAAEAAAEKTRQEAAFEAKLKANEERRAKEKTAAKKEAHDELRRSNQKKFLASKSRKHGRTFKTTAGWQEFEKRQNLPKFRVAEPDKSPMEKSMSNWDDFDLEKSTIAERWSKEAHKFGDAAVESLLGPPVRDYPVMTRKPDTRKFKKETEVAEDFGPPAPESKKKRRRKPKAAVELQTGPKPGFKPPSGAFSSAKLAEQEDYAGGARKRAKEASLAGRGKFHTPGLEEELEAAAAAGKKKAVADTEKAPKIRRSRFIKSSWDDFDLEKGVLDTEDREDLKTSQFALPKKAKTEEARGESGNYPIPDESHARFALAMVAKHGTPEEKAKVRAAVHKKYPSIGESDVSKSNWDDFDLAKAMPKAVSVTGPTQRPSGATGTSTIAPVKPAKPGGQVLRTASIPDPSKVNPDRRVFASSDLSSTGTDKTSSKIQSPKLRGGTAADVNVLGSKPKRTFDLDDSEEDVNKSMDPVLAARMHIQPISRRGANIDPQTASVGSFNPHIASGFVNTTQMHIDAPRPGRVGGPRKPIK